MPMMIWVRNVESILVRQMPDVIRLMSKHESFVDPVTLSEISDFISNSTADVFDGSSHFHLNCLQNIYHMS